MIPTDLNIAPSVIKNLDGSSARGMIASLLRKQRTSAAKQRGMSLFSDRHTAGGLEFPRRRRCRRLIICGKNSRNSGNRCPADVLYCERFGWFPAPKEMTSRRAGLGLAIAADFGAVERREAQKAESGEEWDQGDQVEGEREIADRDLGGAGDDRQECGADCDAKPRASC